LADEEVPAVSRTEVVGMVHTEVDHHVVGTAMMVRPEGTEVEDLRETTDRDEDPSAPAVVHQDLRLDTTTTIDRRQTVICQWIHAKSRNPTKIWTTFKIRKWN